MFHQLEYLFLVMTTGVETSHVQPGLVLDEGVSLEEHEQDEECAEVVVIRAVGAGTRVRGWHENRVFPILVFCVDSTRGVKAKSKLELILCSS